MSQKRDDRSNERIQSLQQLRDRALAANGGGRSFAQWKAAALDDVVQMVRRAERMELVRADLHGDLDLVYRIRMPVPRFPRGQQLVLGDSVLFHLVYRDQWREEPPPGWLPVGVFEPFDLWHPNSHPHLRGALCLGDVSANTPPTELILAGYYLACLQDYSLDEQDPHGVLNAAACEYYRCHPEYLPLSPVGLYEAWTPDTSMTLGAN